MPTMCARENPSSPSTRSSMGTYRTGGATSGWVFRDMVSMRRRYQGVMACANTVIALRSWLAVASRDYEAGGLRLVRLGAARVKPRTPRCGGGLSRVETTAAPARVTWPQNGVFGVCWRGAGFI